MLSLSSPIMVFRSPGGVAQAPPKVATTIDGFPPLRLPDFGVAQAPPKAAMTIDDFHTAAPTRLRVIVVEPMRKNFALAIGFAFSVALLAHQPVAAKSKKETVFSVKGEVVDLVCYMSDGKEKGESHEACAHDCITAGNPAGLLTSGGKLWLLLGKDMKPANDQLAPYAAKQVRIKGKKCSRGEMSGVIVESIEE